MYKNINMQEIEQNLILIDGKKYKVTLYVIRYCIITELEKWGPYLEDLHFF